VLVGVGVVVLQVMARQMVEEVRVVFYPLLDFQ
jgi:hypothetical protein